MATREEVELNAPHPPTEKAKEAFTILENQIKDATIKSRHHWDKHEPRMWSRASGLSDSELVDFNIDQDLVQIRSGPTAYGTMIFGKIRIPKINDEEGEGFVHVRIHDPPNRGDSDVLFHSLLTEEGDKDEDGHPRTWRAIQTADKELDFFVE